MHREMFLAQQVDMKCRMWKREYMDGRVDLLKSWGYNTILYEIEDKFRYTGHPLLVHPDAPSHEETSAFVEGCRSRGVEVIPLFQTLGHAESIVGKEEYTHLRETPEVTDQYDPLSEEARALILEFIDEIIEVTRPKEFFHVGGDETWSLGKSEKCVPVVKEIGIGGLYLRHMMPILEHIHRRGLRPIIWADMLLSHPEVLEKIPKYVILNDWDYSTTSERPDLLRIWGASDEKPYNPMVKWPEYSRYAGPDFVKHLEKFAVDGRTRRDGTFPAFYCTDALRALGFDVITSPAVRSFGDMYGVGNHAVHLPNCWYFARKGARETMGTLVTSWAVRYTHPEVCQIGSFAAVFGIDSDKPFDLEELGSEYSKDFYGAEMPDFPKAVERAQKGFGPVRFPPLQEILAQGKEELRNTLRRLDEYHGDRGGAIDYVGGLVDGYSEAGNIFQTLKQEAKKNAGNLDFWMEGVNLDILCADIMLAVLEGKVKERAPTLLDRMEGLKRGTRSLFAETYEPHSVDDEIDVRYGTLENYLKAAAGA